MDKTMFPARERAFPWRKIALWGLGTPDCSDGRPRNSVPMRSRPL